MVLLIREEEVDELLSMADASEAVADSFRQLGSGKAFNNPRTRIKLGGEMLHVLPAALPEMDALGLKSYTAFQSGIRFVVLLYSAKSGDLKAIIQAQRLGELRTGAAASVAIQQMAREGVSRGALFGAGTMGGAMLEGMVHARQVERVAVYDTVPDRLHAFCDEMSAQLGIAITPADSPHETVEEAGIVVTMTTSRVPVFEGKHLQDGTTVVAAGSNLLQKREIDSTVVRRANRIVVESIEQAQLEAGDLFPAVDSGYLHWNQVHELSSLLLGLIPGRETKEEINLFKSVGLGIQDMAVAARVYEKAVHAGAGSELPI